MKAMGPIVFPTIHATAHPYGKADARSLRPGPAVRFGVKLPDLPMEPYQDVFERFESLDQYGHVDLQAGHHLLSKRARRYVKRLQLAVSPEEINAYRRSGRFGILEEAADMLFELYTLKALQAGWINPESVNRWVEVMRTRQRQGKPFFELLDDVTESLPDASVAAYQQLTGLSEKRAREFLGLTVIKFVHLRERYPSLPLLRDTRPRLLAEARELVDRMPWCSPARLKLLGLGLLYGRLPALPVRPFRQEVLGFVSRRLGGSVGYDDLMQYVFIKQLGRQEMDYEHHALTSKERKRALKPFEILLEAYILKRAGVFPTETDQAA